MDSDIKKQCEELYNDLGMMLTTAINVFLRQSLRNKDHSLSGNWEGHRECHILPDWLLVYRMEDDVLVLTLVRNGTHSDVFGE